MVTRVSRPFAGRRFFYALFSAAAAGPAVFRRQAELKKEGIVTIDEARARTQDIRPLKILILNLMPIKKPTEIQLLRLLGDTPLQLDVHFARMASRETSHTDKSYLARNYLTYEDIKDDYYDGFIITGAPVEKIPYEEVEYWPEFLKYIEWANTHVSY